MNIDRLYALSQQRKALDQQAAQARLKSRLAADEAAFEARAHIIAATTVLRALSASVEHGYKQDRRSLYPVGATTPHPNSAGRKPLMTNFPTERHPRILPGGKRVFEEV